ncbi:MAG: cytochrome P450, partial [Solirubrobacteraceae bacterium]
MKSALPPGPRMPVVLQSLGFWTRPIAFWESAGARYGQRFTFRLVGMPPLVAISDPEEIKEIFLAPPDVLHPGEGTRLLGILGPIVGPNSVTLQDGEAHLKQRRLLLPAFHGERIQRLEGLVAQLAEREVDTWAQGEPISLHGRLHQLTLEIILRAVFGLEEGARLDELRKLLTEVLAITESPLSLLPPLSPVLARFGAPARLERRAARVGEMIFALIDARRAARGGEDVLALLLDAEHEDGSPMSAEQVRDELMTALVAGHETTASQLAWTFERISREPAVLARL